MSLKLELQSILMQQIFCSKIHHFFLRVCIIKKKNYAHSPLEGIEMEVNETQPI